MFSLKVKNFRSFKDQEFNFSKINILIGENSSGKSSILKLLLALKQTVNSNKNKDLNFVPRGEYTDLGTYKDLVYYENEELPVSFEFNFKTDYYSFFKPLFKHMAEESREEINFSDLFGSNNPRTKTSLQYEITKELNKHQVIKTTIKNSLLGCIKISFESEELDPNQVLLFGNRCTIIFEDNETGITFIIKDIGYTKFGFISLIDSASLNNQLQKEVKILGKKHGKNKAELDSLMNRLYFKIAFLLITQNQLRYFLDKIEYINPIHTSPSRAYLLKDKKSIDTINDIEDFIEFLSSNTEESIALFKELNAILVKMGIAEEMDVITDEKLPVRILKIKVKDLLSNIMDVGYGVSLILPVLLKALIVDRNPKRKGSIILIEQPEVHLHPKLHAELIEVLISLSKNTTYFIETHSEHIVRKIQVLTKKNAYSIKPADVSIHYFRRDFKVSNVTTHKILKTGFLEPKFPTGFFDSSYLLAKELLD